MQIRPIAVAADDLRPELQLVPAPEPDHPPATRRSYALELDDAPEALERVLSQLRRRRCRVTDVVFVAPDAPGDPAHLVVETEAPGPHAHLVEAWLAEPLSVLSVEPIGG